MGTIQIQPNRKMKLWKFQKAIVERPTPPPKAF